MNHTILGSSVKARKRSLYSVSLHHRCLTYSDDEGLDEDTKKNMFATIYRTYVDRQQEFLRFELQITLLNV